MINSVPRPEHPRPDFFREDWQNLNGQWEFAFDDEDRGIQEQWFLAALDHRITVPFCYQSQASGIHLPEERHDILWYARSFAVKTEDKQVLLHFGAVDYRASVWVNGIHVGEHEGGYTPFSLNITHALHDTDQNRLVVRVEDTPDCTQPRGKQNWEDEPFGCWYTPVSGIWQTVWLERVGKCHIKRFHITPDIDARRAYLDMEWNRCAGAGKLRLEIQVDFADGTGRHSKVCSTTVDPGPENQMRITLDISEPHKVDEIHYWTPETPNLYAIRFLLWNGRQLMDEVEGYFGMRKIEVRDGRILLNNRPYFQRLVLDQGYWEESLLTPPSDEAIKRDVELTKLMGFNGARKHQKIEDPRYYYWADKLGLLVWGEVPSTYQFSVGAMQRLCNTVMEFIKRDYNHPCIVMWAPLNESWGVRNICTDRQQQQFAVSLYHLIKAVDSTRLVSTNDGWEQVASDICAIHDYVDVGANLHPDYQDIYAMGSVHGSRLVYADGFRYEGQPVLITEYGGAAFERDSTGSNWGYGDCIKTPEELQARIEDISQAFCSLPYVQGYCYTQLTDVFQEVNGLLTMDREPKLGGLQKRFFARFTRR